MASNNRNAADLLGNANTDGAGAVGNAANSDLPANSNPTLDANYELDESSVTWPTEPA